MTMNVTTAVHIWVMARDVSREALAGSSAMTVLTTAFQVDVNATNQIMTTGKIGIGVSCRDLFVEAEGQELT